MLSVVVVALLLTGGAGAEISVVVPNPVAENDAGEYIVLTFHDRTNLSGWAITDGETTVMLPNRTVIGRIAVTTDPGAVRAMVDLPVVRLRGGLALANDGERIRLTYRGTSIDAVTYSRAPEGERYVRTNVSWEWHTMGATAQSITRAFDATARVYVLPDAPDAPVSALNKANDRILLAGYTFASPRVTRSLCQARGRGVRVQVLVEGEPVGGITQRSAGYLDELVDCGVEVRVIGGPYARYAFHHAKYAVVDDDVVVQTENWKPSGTGGRSNRGWGIVVASPQAASTLASTFVADAGWRDAVGWRVFRRNATFGPAGPLPATRYQARFRPQVEPVDRVDILLAPDNAESGLIGVLTAANDSIRIQQVAIGDRNHPLLQAALRAARRGVTVRVLLSGVWYVREENTLMVEWLRARAASEGLPVEARMVEPRGRFRKSHVKGVIVDDDRVIIGSLNWNNNSLRDNRETVVVVYDEAVGEYYTRVFVADWQRGAWRLPIGLLAATIVPLIVGQWIGRRTIAFDPELQ